MQSWSVFLLTLAFIFQRVNGFQNDISPEVVQRKGNNTSDCETACQAETLIQCHYFKFLESSHVCLLSVTDNPQSAPQSAPQKSPHNFPHFPHNVPQNMPHIHNLPQNIPHNVHQNTHKSDFDVVAMRKYLREKQEGDRKELGQLKLLKNQMNDLEYKVQNFRQMKSDMEKTLQNIEVQNTHGAESKQAYLQMKSKTEKLMRLSLLMQTEISELMRHRSVNSRDMKLFRLAKQKSDLDIEHVANNMEKLQANLIASKKEDDLNKNELEKLKDKQDQMTEIMRVLKRQVQSTKSELKNNPLVMKILNNQKLLADGLQDMENKLTVFDKKQVKADETYDELYGRVIADEGERRSLANGISSLQKRLKTVQDDIKRIDNPQSSANMERLRLLTTLKNDVALLKRSNEDIERNLKKSHGELQDLIKDIVTVKLSDQSNKAGITAVALAHRHTQHVFDGMRKDQSSVLNKIHVLEDVYKRILEVVHNIEVHQIQLKQEISHFDEAIKNIAENMKRKLDDTQGETLSNRASALGVALDKLSSESESSLDRQSLATVENRKVNPHVRKPVVTQAPIQKLQTQVNSLILNEEKGKQAFDQIQEEVNKAVVTTKSPVNEFEELGKPVVNSLSEKIQKVQENLKNQKKSSEEKQKKVIEELSQGVLSGSSKKNQIKNKKLKTELAKRKSALNLKKPNPAKKATATEKKATEKKATATVKKSKA